MCFRNTYEVKESYLYRRFYHTARHKKSPEERGFYFSWCQEDIFYEYLTNGFFPVTIAKLIKKPNQKSIL